MEKPEIKPVHRIMRQDFPQSDNIRDHIFPLLRVKMGKTKVLEPDGFELIGTGFLIGSRGFALTAAHVIEQCFIDLKENEAVGSLFWNAENAYVGFQIIASEKHPTEDVGIIKLLHDDLYSIFQINDDYQGSSCAYTCWGYPRETAEEVKKLYEGAHQQPDLIYTEGYIRRRISRPLFPTIIFRGEQFYELSEQVGEGNSGGPVILKNSIGKHKWEVIGIYIGEKDGSVISDAGKNEDRSLHTVREGARVSYAVRAEAFAHWKPDLLKGKTIKEESHYHRFPGR